MIWGSFLSEISSPCNQQQQLSNTRQGLRSGWMHNPLKCLWMNVSHQRAITPVTLLPHNAVIEHAHHVIRMPNDGGQQGGLVEKQTDHHDVVTVMAVHAAALQAARIGVAVSWHTWQLLLYLQRRPEPPAAACAEALPSPAYAQYQYQLSSHNFMFTFLHIFAVILLDAAQPRWCTYTCIETKLIWKHALH